SSIPRRPARPVSCVYSPGVRNSCCSPVNFDSFSITTDRAGMLIPSDSVSVANTIFTRPAPNASSTASFIGGTIPARCAGRPAARVEARRFGVGSRFAVALDERREQADLIAAPLPHHVEMLEADRSPLLDDRRRLSPDRLDPRCELLGVRDRRRQAHHANV